MQHRAHHEGTIIHSDQEGIVSDVCGWVCAEEILIQNLQAMA
jgi:hypothetical protein